MTLYDYKRKYKVSFPFCKKGDMSRCLKIVLNIFGYFIITVLSIPLLLITIGLIDKYIVPILDILLENFDFVVEVIEEFL